MASIITEVHSLSAGSGWFFEDFGAASLGDFRAVACFALVTTFDPAFISLGSDKCVVPLSIDQIGQSLIGEVAPSEDVVHEHEIRGRLLS